MKPLQETFDKVASHLLLQKKKSMLTFQCAYRGAEGTSCAIGCLIPDEMYTLDLEGCGIRSPKVIKLLEQLGYTDDILFLAHLQGIHDKEYVEFWPEKLASLAKLFGLNTNVIKEMRDA